LALITADGNGLAVTFTGADIAVQPELLVTLTVYEPDAVALIV
jgi:hypothetical protein